LIEENEQRKQKAGYKIQETGDGEKANQTAYSGF
jgi:hypothetical protein